MIEPADKPDINVVIESYGGRVFTRSRYMTGCVFHEDKTPSMSVNTELNAWNCKSCGQSGDSLNMIQIKESCDFRRAIEVAAALGQSTGGAGGGGVELRGSRFGSRRGPVRKGDHKGDRKFVPSWRRS